MANGNDLSPIQTDQGPAVYMGPDPPVSTRDALNALYGLTGLPDIQSAYSAAQRGEYLPALGQGAAGIAALGSIFNPEARAAEAGLSRLGDVSGLMLPEKGVQAYHGSAAAFQKFLDQFIGTGEGAQVYGMGHYVGGARGTAESYIPPGEKNAIYWGDYNLRKHGVTGLSWGADRQVLNYLDSSLYQKILKSTDKDWESGYIDDALNNLKADAQFHREMAADPKTYAPTSQEQSDELEEAYDWIDKNRQHLNLRDDLGGHLYQVDVIPDHERFMDWDLPFSQQPKSVQDKLNQIHNTFFSDVGPPHANETGKQIYNYITARMFNQLKYDEGDPHTGRELAKVAQARASSLLDTYGIPGNTYKDQFSRNAETQLEWHNNSVDDAQRYVDHLKEQGYADPEETVGKKVYQRALNTLKDRTAQRDAVKAKVDDPTYNYVVFNPENIDIRTMDGIPLIPVEHTPIFPGGVQPQ